MPKPTAHSPFLTRGVCTALSLTSLFLFPSCGNFSPKGLAKKSVSYAGKSINSAGTSLSYVKKTVSSVSKSITKILPSRLPIAEVRAHELQEIPTGADRLLTWERNLYQQRYASNNFVTTLKNYQFPSLPSVIGLPVDGAILPPLHPGQSNLPNAIGTLPQ